VKNLCRTRPQRLHRQRLEELPSTNSSKDRRDKNPNYVASSNKSDSKINPTVNSQTILEDGIALCTFKTARVTAEPTAMPIRHADTTNMATRFAFTCSIRFNLKDDSDYENNRS
jgi:hypothetical protein